MFLRVSIPVGVAVIFLAYIIWSYYYKALKETQGKDTSKHGKVEWIVMMSLMYLIISLLSLKTIVNSMTQVSIAGVIKVSLMVILIIASFVYVIARAPYKWKKHTS